MSTDYFLSHPIDKEVLRKKNWSFSRKESDSEFHLVGSIEIDGNDFYLHFYLDEDTKEIISFCRYNSNFPAAARLVHQLCDLGYEFNNLDAEKVVYDDDILQELFYEHLKKKKGREGE